jgi:hypothetical protein
MSIVQLPDLARKRAIEDEIRASCDEDVEDILDSDDGVWFLVECGPHMASDVARRVAKILAATANETLFMLIGLDPAKGDPTSGGAN